MCLCFSVCEGFCGLFLTCVCFVAFVVLSCVFMNNVVDFVWYFVVCELCVLCCGVCFSCLCVFRLCFCDV